MAHYAVTDPATGETIRSYPSIDDGELEAAIARADGAHEAWSRGTSLAERSATIARIADLHEQRSEELGRIISREMGKPIRQAVGEVAFASSIYRYYADHAESLMADEPIDLIGKDGSALIRRSSLGVLLGIMPWNYPYYQVARFAGPNLMIGNTILLKPAPQCPESAAALASLLRDAGVPDDVYITILATDDQISTAIADRRVQGVSLTGSGRAGAVVAEQAGRHLKRVVLELGGSDPFIVLGTDDIDALVETAVAARMPNAGQACNSAKRFLVVEEIYDEFVEKFTAALLALEPGDPRSPQTRFGPLSSAGAAERLDEQVRRATEQGATLVGGGRDGSFFRSGVLTGVTPDNDAYGEELFGPVAQVYKISGEDEAIAIANATEYGLGSYVFTPDREQALRVADRIEAGMVFINVINGGGAEIPFGGIKASGFGRELGRLGADEFVNKKMIRIG